MKKLTQLTSAQTARMPSFAQEWIEYGLRTHPPSLLDRTNPS